MHTSPLSLSPGRRWIVGASGFTVLELLVVVTMLAVLATLLVPALAATKPGNKMAQCLNNQRQLAFAWQLYAADNVDAIISSTAWITGFMDWSSSSANTNTAYLTNTAYSTLALYNKNAALFKCPADTYQSSANPGPRVRSVSLNGALTGKGGSGPMVEGSAPNGGTYYGATPLGAGPCVKLTALSKPGPAAVFVFIDEHPDSINDGQFLLNPGYPTTAEVWRDLPASYHDNGAGLSYGDGHADIHKWQNAGGQTTYSVTYTSYAANAPWSLSTMRSSADYQWLQAGMPYH